MTNSYQKIIKAAHYAAAKHSHQRRKNVDATPYINHPLEVADLLVNVGGITDEDVITAALLHDTIEDTATTPADIAQSFGLTVLGYVLELTDDKSLPKAERKQLQITHASSLSIGAKQIKLADKIANVHAVAYDPPKDWSITQQQEYLDWAYRAYENLHGANQALENLFFKEYQEGIEQIRLRSTCSEPTANCPKPYPPPAGSG